MRGKNANAWVVATWLAVPGTLGAQVAWDSPHLTPPRPAMGLGIYLVEPAFTNGLGALVQWRMASLLGLRFGIAEQGDEVAAFGGVDVGGMLLPASAEVPLDIAWLAGAGIGAGDLGAVISVPFGVTIGHSFDLPELRFMPYASPRLVLDIFAYDDDEVGRRARDDLELDVAVDLGFDVDFGQTWLIRFGGTLGKDRDALAIGIVF